MSARRWIAYAAAGLLAIAVIPAVSMAKSHVTKPAPAHRPLTAALHKPVVHTAARKHVAHKPVKHVAKHTKTAAKKNVHHKLHKKGHVTHKAAVKKTTAVTVPAPTAPHMF